VNGFLALDRSIFLLLNGRWVHPWLDRFFPYLTDLDHFTVLLAAVWIALLAFGGAKGRRAALLVALALLVTDQLVNEVVKPWVGRPRPCIAVEEARVLVKFARSPSFPSSHAANITAAMTVLAYFYRRWTPLLASLAFLVGYSRIYVGVHYPLDVFAGSAFGFAVAAGAVAAGPGIERGLVRLRERIRARRGRERVL
jgi:undecaprenyl-diphosphatase